MAEAATPTLPENLPPQIWIGFDWAQAELYKLCLFSKDPVLKAALTSKDVHRYVIHRVYQIPMDQVTGDQRNLAKIISYALIYSGFDLQSTVAIVCKKSGLDKATVEEALHRYVEEFHVLFEWVGQAILDWFDAGGYVTYYMGARRRVLPPDYLKRDLETLRRHKSGRTAVNAYGQNSVGLLLKHAVYSQIWRDPFLRQHTHQHIPVFDAAYMLADTEHLAQILQKLDWFARPLLRHEGFEIRMKTEWKGSLQSWGQLVDIPHPSTLPGYPEEPWVIEWHTPKHTAGNQEDFAQAIVDATLNPFAPGGTNAVNPFAPSA